MRQIVPMILDKMVEQLTLHCQTNVSVDDDTYVDIVKKGLLQENRVKDEANVALGITGGDHEDPAYIDGIVSLEDFERIGFDIHRIPHEVGGGTYWWRRGVVRVEAFFIRNNLSEDEAFEAGYLVLARVQQYLALTNLTGLEDDFGEMIAMGFPIVYANTYFESGGKPASYIFRGKVKWACLTERP